MFYLFLVLWWFLVFLGSSMVWMLGSMLFWVIVILFSNLFSFLLLWMVSCSCWGMMWVFLLLWVVLFVSFSILVVSYFNIVVSYIGVLVLICLV